MALVIVPVACDDHAVFSLWSEGDHGFFMGLICEDCDTTYPPEED